MCILYIIKSCDVIYGYDLIKKMTVYFPEVNESTFYSILRRLHKSNFTYIILKDISNGPQRKYYTITQEGEKWLNKNIEEWRELIKITELIGIDRTWSN
ncbi:MAG: PadR family transcriptional regulator [Lachnospiraceae bacterium]